MLVIKILNNTKQNGIIPNGCKWSTYSNNFKTGGKTKNRKTG